MEQIVIKHIPVQCVELQCDRCRGTIYLYEATDFDRKELKQEGWLFYHGKHKLFRCIRYEKAEEVKRLSNAIVRRRIYPKRRFIFFNNIEVICPDCMEILRSYTGKIRTTKYRTKYRPTCDKLKEICYA